MKKALFLDRDGTINVDVGYVHRIEDFTFIPGIFEFCVLAQRLGYLIIVITNQSGIERGYFTEVEYQDVTAYMIAEFARRGVTVTDVFHCPSLEGYDRKPNPGLFLKAQSKYDIDMHSSISIGDKERDVKAGEAAGVGHNFLFQGVYPDITGW